MKVSHRQDTFHDCGVGGERHVVLVHTPGVITFGLQYADHAKRDGVEPHHTSDRTASVGEQVIHYGLSQHAYLGGRFDILFRKELAVCHFALLYGEVIFVDPVYAGRGVVVTVNELSGTVDRRTDGCQVFCFIAYAFVVFQFQGLHFVGIQTHAAAHIRSRMYHDHIRTHFRDLFADAAFRALADGQHGNNRGHADDDAESRQKRT